MSTVILGAGPAGLTAAYELGKAGRTCTVVESDPAYVGGISRTVQWRGNRFDIGGHRFFSKNGEIEALWREILPEDVLEVPRLSRIYYEGKFYDYPLKPRNALRNLGLGRSFLCGMSYLYRRMRPIRPEVSFKDWVTNRFGDRLFATFFETYTEKVWGMRCDEISADWAAQRIKGLSLMKAALAMFKPSGDSIKTLIDRFRYPRLGPGQMWETCTERVRGMGSTVDMDRRVVRIERGEGAERVICRDGDGAEHVYPCREVISSMPLRELVEAMDPAPPDAVLAAARSLRYRDYLLVAVHVNRKDCFPDNWIYIHDPGVKMGRIQNFRNWSEAMVADPETSVLGLEYFCFEGDELWDADDADLIARGKRELAQLGLVDAAEIGDGTVVRMPKAYPIYDDGYRDAVATIRDWLRAEVPNVAPAGRNGMHKYNNQDHSMMAALLSARNLLGTDDRDPWKVNTDAEYHEEASAADDQAGRAVPSAIRTTT
ncbi:MAG: NAD(P)/FAD-dependent oxidoreductase [Planctomycetota bacterium]